MDDLKIGLIADIQYADADPFKNRHFKNGLKKLDHCLESLRPYSPDFLVNLGDSIDHGFQNLRPVLDKFDNFTAPIYHLAGNHDFEVAETEKESVLSMLGLPTCGYHSFTIGKYRCLLLNSNAVSLHAYPNGHRCHAKASQRLKDLERDGYVYANFWNGGLGYQQLQWMKKELQFSRQVGETVLIFCHQPFYPEDRHNLWDTQSILKMISNYNHVVAWFCGHNHDGNYGLWNRCHCINLKGLVETETEICCAYAEIQEDVIEIKGFGRERDLRLIL
ncbi:MAG: metallophosphoesterase [Cyclobacteriaceae bacterium]|nr:metallophosphoesterase [Cyclobacteriaceae bacterium]